MPPEYLPGDEDDENKDSGEGDENKDVDAEGAGKDADADKDETKPEDKGEQSDLPTEQDDSEKSEGDDEPPETSEADIKAKLMEILADRDDQIETKISKGIEARETAAKAEKVAEAEAGEVLDLFKRARPDNDDEVDRAEALTELGARTLKTYDTAQAEAPIIEKAKKAAAAEFDGQFQEGMDIVLSEVGLADVANSFTAEEKAELQPSKFKNRNDWTRAVARAAFQKAKGGGGGSDKNKAERRSRTAERAKAGAGTARMPRGQAGDEAEKQGQTAREFILGGKD